MKAIVGRRQTGKTTALIKRSAKDWHYIVCHSRQEAHRIFGVAKRLGLDIPLPITYDEFLSKSYFAPGIRGLLIDNVGMLLTSLSSVPIHAFTVTTEGRNDNEV